jgi:predicted metalloprotease with PDZ domain
MPCALQAQGISYRVAVGRSGDRAFRVSAELPVPAGRDTFLVSLPAWTPGSYEILNFARYVHGFAAATPDGHPLFWDKLDKDTWRIATAGARQVVVTFETNPDSVSLELCRIGPDFAFLNGADLFPYPEGAGFDFAADVEFDVPAGWRIATALAPGGRPGQYRAASYHDLVDSPTFLGRFALDSVAVDGKTIRLAIWPDTALTSAVWDSIGESLRRIAATQDRLMGGPPYDDYTVFIYAPPEELSWAGGLEHRNSQFDIISLGFLAPDRRHGVLGQFTRPLLAHEFFHLWNVKRIRPAAMWPYDYAREQATPLLWWSEGVTDYYADVTLARSGLWSPAAFVASANSNAQQVESAAEIVSAEDASVDTWIHPTWVDEEQYYYYKGSLLGLMLDIEIRAATANAHSLDDVMRALLNDFYRRQKGFTTGDLLALVRPWYAGVDDFYRRYIQGREPLPYDSVLPLGGIAVAVQEARTPVVGVEIEKPVEGGVLVAAVAPGSLAESVGLQPGDVLVRLGDIPTTGLSWPALFRARYTKAAGQPLQVVFRRDGREITRTGTLQVRTSRVVSLRPDPNPAPAARAIFAGITGR